ncbi:hypothetical protein KUW09_15425 [Mameliella alba]|nr:hypothetical protein [Antarctobacter heliothermus]MBY6145444.1 hypothetical protein [Mameliella alba]MCA0955192.1 hypothetical protein [Mameliella alba]
MRRAALATLVSGVMLATICPAETVGRFDVHADLPGGYDMGPRPGNDDGRAFFYADGAEIRLWGGWVMDSLAAERRSRLGFYLADGARVTYEASGRDWFVLSGYDGDVIFYLRVEQGRTCGGEEALAYLELRYPEHLRSTYDPRIGGIAGSLGFGPC